MFPMCAMHNIDFCDFLEDHELSQGVYLAGNVDLLLTDPLYNFLHIQNDANAV